MKKLLLALTFSVSCTPPTVLKTNYGMMVTRYFSGPTPEEIIEIEKLAVAAGLCYPWEFAGIEVEVFPIPKLFSGGPMEEVHGKASYDEETGISHVTVAGRYDFSCRTFLHEVVHACQQQRSKDRSDGHGNRKIWSPQANGGDQLRSEYVKKIAHICP